MQKLKPTTLTVFFPSDMEISGDRATWYLESAIRGHWKSFAHDADPIREMSRACVAFQPTNSITRPAAPVDGLERYARTQFDELQDQFGMTPHKYGEYVRFDQAEAIIAAVRAEHDNTKAVLAAANADAKDYREYSERLKSRLETTEADNAALTARVKELEADVSAYILSAEDQDKRRKALETQLAAAEKALTQLRSDCQSPIDMYERNGPEFNSPQGNEYESTSHVMAKFAELVASIDAALEAKP